MQPKSLRGKLPSSYVKQFRETFPGLSMAVGTCREVGHLLHEKALLMRGGTAGIGNMEVGSRDLTTDAAFKAPTDYLCQQ